MKNNKELKLAMRDVLISQKIADCPPIDPDLSKKLVDEFVTLCETHLDQPEGNLYKLYTPNGPK